MLGNWVMIVMLVEQASQEAESCGQHEFSKSLRVNALHAHEMAIQQMNETYPSRNSLWFKYWNRRTLKAKRGDITLAEFWHGWSVEAQDEVNRLLADDLVDGIG